MSDSHEEDLDDDKLGMMLKIPCTEKLLRRSKSLQNSQIVYMSSLWCIMPMPQLFKLFPYYFLQIIYNSSIFTEYQA
jgi:hypothetical protein